jgi:hypothetical protein
MADPEILQPELNSVSKHLSLIPTTSLSKLARLRGRERVIRVVWGFVRWLALALTLFALAAIADWWIDKYRDTPSWVRVILTALQLIICSVAALFWIVLPWFRGPSLIRLAKRVEEKLPEFDHRLITAIQLTHSNAQVGGMSPQLIRMVSEEAERISSKHDLTALADTRRLKWSMALIAWPLGVLMFLLLFFGPTLLAVLFQRQLLVNADIPRDVALTTATAKNPWPAGDEVTVRYIATSKSGKLDKEMKGTVIYVSSETDHEDQCELIWDDRTEFSGERAIFKAKVPHSSQKFTYRARLGDGRTRQSDEVTFEPRPQITIDTVWLQAPGYMPDRREVVLSGKNIKGYDGSHARIRVHAQKPIVQAKLLLCQINAKGDEVVAVERDMKILPPVTGDDGAEQFPAESDYSDMLLSNTGSKYSAYRITVKDNNGFDSADKPRGSIEVEQPSLPTVKLFPENETKRGEVKSEDDILEGMPVPLGGRFKVEFTCRSDIGICTPYRRPGENNRLIEPAWLVYQVNEGPLNYLPLREIPETAETGPYTVARASFANLDHQARALKNQVPFHARPAHEPGEIPRLDGGGFFDVNTQDLRKLGADGKESKLELNDRISFWIEVYDCDPAVGREPGKSEIRVKTVRTPEEVAEIAQNAQREREAIQAITKRQQEISTRAQEKP